VNTGGRISTRLAEASFRGDPPHGRFQTVDYTDMRDSTLGCIGLMFFSAAHLDRRG